MIPRRCGWAKMTEVTHDMYLGFIILAIYTVFESSMFITQHRFILKTCGTTTPLQCLQPLLLLVEQYAGFDDVKEVFYSRKNFKRPELQMNPYQAFEQEVSLLNTYFQDGLAYCLGSQDKECWYLYTWSSRGIGGDEEEDRGPDQTLEILMSELDPEVMSIFTREESSSAAEATQKSGIANLIPNMVIDDYLFEPCGYSMNGIAKSGCYMTIHITPEPEFSYVSFECNVPQASYKEVISRVLETFQPGKFVLTVFANKASVASDAPQELQKIPAFGDWLRHDMQYCRLQNYDFIYAFYSKFPS
uniref:S-adenosylmethionine decarboxylase proenzyme n=1 Tax=Timema tahoe TaxID=61484 RepID=A0A7R9FL29_9NEOP|nr:unnamed protein product [Timema tahoe]